MSEHEHDHEQGEKVEERPAVKPERRQREATFADLKGKQRRKATVPIVAVDDDGHEIELQVKMTAISSRAYDDLVAKHPPTRTQQGMGATYNVDTFAPALIAAVCTQPQMTVEEATELYESDNWSSGEAGGLFWACLRLCNAGLDVPFTGTG